MQKRGLVKPSDFRFKVPSNFFSRIDMRDGRPSYTVPFTIDKGGDYLLRKIKVRYDTVSGTITEGVTPAVPDPITLERRYVNLNFDYQGTPGHSGLVADPWDISDWQAAMIAQVSMDPGFDITMTGVYDHYDPAALAAIQFNNNGVLNWYRANDPAVNGPWRIRTNVPLNFQGSVALTGGIICCQDNVTGYRTDFMPDMQSPHMYNMWIEADRIKIGGIDDDKVAGNMFVCRQFENAGVNYTDCIVVCDELLGGGAQMINCGIFYGTLTGPLEADFVNCFRPGYSPTVPPGLPAWNEADRTLFRMDTIIRGNIPSSVFVGVAPYLNYAAGLWGEARYGIGTGYFYNYSNTLPADIKVSLKKSSSHFKYFEEISPVPFSSPCDSGDCVMSVSPSPVDNDCFSVSFAGTRILASKSFNWAIEDKTTIVVEVERDPAGGTYPQFVDVLIEGYFVDKNEMPGSV